MRRPGSTSDTRIADNSVNQEFSFKDEDVTEQVADDAALYAQVQSDRDAREALGLMQRLDQNRRLCRTDDQISGPRETCGSIGACAQKPLARLAASISSLRRMLCTQVGQGLRLAKVPVSSSR